MYSFAWSLFPVTFTLAAFTTTTGSPVSRCGEKLGLCFPRRRVATRVASRPSVAPSASTSFQCRSISALFVVYVFIALSLVVSLVRRCSAPRSTHLQLLVRLVFVDPSCAFPIFHRDEAQAVRRCARTGPRAVARRDDLAEPPGVDFPAAHPGEGPDDRPDHPAEERVRRDLEPQQRTVRAPLRAPDRPDAAPARREGREVAPADQPRARFAHRRDVQRRGELDLPQPLERQTLGRVADPVFVCAARRGEPCVEVLLRRLELRDRDVLREKGVDPPPDRLSVQRARRPEVDDLPCRVHPRVGPPRAGDPDAFVADRGERALELRLHRRRVRLHLESGVARPVVGHARLPVRRLGRCSLRSLLGGPLLRRGLLSLRRGLALLALGPSAAQREAAARLLGGRGLVGLFFVLRLGGDELEEHERRRIADAVAQADAPQIARAAIGVAGREVGEYLVDDDRLRQPRERATARGKGAVLSEVDHLVHEDADLLGLCLGGLHALVAQDGERQVPQHRSAVAGLASELALVYLVRHRLFLVLGLARDDAFVPGGRLGLGLGLRLGLVRRRAYLRLDRAPGGEPVLG